MVIAQLDFMLSTPSQMASVAFLQFCTPVFRAVFANYKLAESNRVRWFIRNTSFTRAWLGAKELIQQRADTKTANSTNYISV